MKDSDDKQTPPELARAILSIVDWTRVQSVMDPCRGSGAFYNQIPRGRAKHWREIQFKYTRVYSSWPRSYLTGPLPQVDLTISNIPFSLSTPFIDRALSHSKAVVFLARLSLFGSEDRAEAWDRWPDLSHLLTIRPRASFSGDGKTDSVDTALFCWDRYGYLKVPRRFQQIGWQKPGMRRRKAA